MIFQDRLDKQSKAFKLFLGVVLIGVVGFFEYVAGYEVEFSLFYVIPVSFVTWFTGRLFGLVVSFISAVVWLGVDVASGHPYTHLFTPLWNTFIRFSFFVVIAVLLSALRNALEHEARLARTDNLTGTVNSRYFYEVVQKEMDRLKRYGHFFTLVYIDLDNFKIVNDEFGHAAGDQALRVVASFIQSHIRRTDVVARLGGDEFALLLLETDREVAHVVVSNVRTGLLEEMRQRQWPITFSIGVVTCRAVPPTVDAVVHMADELMYSIKRDGKDAVKYFTYTG
ncbi:MAG TPA: diguanylate cyclase [Deltaproteobacteria bacterium]|nr:diguanylate cyclase [Deltaproteobacteria bacterium]